MTKWSILAAAGLCLAPTTSSDAFVLPSARVTTRTALSMKPDDPGRWFQQQEESWGGEKAPQRHHREYREPYDGRERSSYPQRSPAQDYHPMGRSYYSPTPTSSRSVPGPDYLESMQPQNRDQGYPHRQQRRVRPYSPTDPRSMGHPAGRRRPVVPGSEYLNTVQTTTINGNNFWVAPAESTAETEFNGISTITSFCSTSWKRNTLSGDVSRCTYVRMEEGKTDICLYPTTRTAPR